MAEPVQSSGPVETAGAACEYTQVLGTVAGKRRGFTSGTAAQAAAKAAATFAFFNTESDTVSITLPPGKKPYSGKAIAIPISFYKKENEWYHAGVVKDAGDDEDSTHGAIIAARVRLQSRQQAEKPPPILLRGGSGVGRVTRPGLPVAPGKSAINPVPKKMIIKELESMLRGASVSEGTAALEVEIYVPEGENLAKKTWNPRLGIEGGISIIGTSGVVEPKSSDAYKASIGSVIRAIRKQGNTKIVITPGYVGEKFLFTGMGIPESKVATVGDHIGWAFSEAERRGFEGGILVGHIGKCAKIAAGIFNTHWTSGDARLETVAALAACEGADRECIRRIMSCKLAEETVPLLIDEGFSGVFSRIAERCVYRLSKLTPELSLEAVILDLEGNPIGGVPSHLMEKEGWEKFQ